MKKYSWLFFDADGTLFDFDDSQEQAFKKTILKFKKSYTSEYSKIYNIINTRIWKDFEQNKITVAEIKTIRFKLLFDELNIKGDYLKASSLYLQFLSEGHKLLEGAEETILKLKDTYNLLLLTNGLSSVQRPRFLKTPMVNYFDHIVISEEVGFSKPQPEIFDLCFSKTAHPAKNEVLMIGDGLGSDIKGGVDYGIDTCWINANGDKPNDIVPTYTINRVSQIFTVL